MISGVSRSMALQSRLDNLSAYPRGIKQRKANRGAIRAGALHHMRGGIYTARRQPLAAPITTFTIYSVNTGPVTTDHSDGPTLTLRQNARRIHSISVIYTLPGLFYEDPTAVFFGIRCFEFGIPVGTLIGFSDSA